MPKLNVFGTVHIDRPGKVKSELEGVSDSIDIIFIEHPRDNPDSTDKRKLLLRNPSLWITSWVISIVWGIPGFLITRSFDSVDAAVTRSVAHEKELVVEPVDMNLMRLGSNISPLITTLSWIWFLLMIFAFAYGILLFSNFLILMVIVMGLLPIAPFAYRTLSDRDKIMAENIEEILTSQEDINKGTLVVGRKHMDGIASELEDTSVEIDKRHKSKFFRRNK